MISRGSKAPPHSRPPPLPLAATTDDDNDGEDDVIVICQRCPPSSVLAQEWTRLPSPPALPPQAVCGTWAFIWAPSSRSTAWPPGSRCCPYSGPHSALPCHPCDVEKGGCSLQVSIENRMGVSLSSCEGQQPAWPFIAAVRYSRYQ